MFDYGYYFIPGNYKNRDGNDYVLQPYNLTFASKNDSCIPRQFLIVLAKESYILKETEDLKSLIRVQEAFMNFSRYKLMS